MDERVGSAPKGLSGCGSRVRQGPSALLGGAVDLTPYKKAATATS